jgi:uncharacterized protein
LLLDGPTLGAVALLALGAAVIGGMGGFGTGVILTAALAPLIGVKALVPVLAVAGVIINAGRFWFYRASVERRALGIVLGASLPFVVLGTWLYSVLDARAIGTILGIAVIASVPLRRFLKRKEVTLGATGLAFGSGVFGLASGLATGTGVILVSLLLGAGLTGPAVLATDALATIALDLCKAALFQRFDRRLGTWTTLRRVVLTEYNGYTEFRASVPRGALIRAVFPLSQARPCYLAGYSPLFRT